MWSAKAQLLQGHGEAVAKPLPPPGAGPASATQTLRFCAPHSVNKYRAVLFADLQTPFGQQHVRAFIQAVDARHQLRVLE